MKIVVHVLVALFVALLISVVWDNGNAGNRQSLPRRRVFGFGRIIPLYAGLAAALFPLVLFEQSFQRPVPFVSVCLLELLAVLAFLYVLSFRICIKDGSVATRCFFLRKEIPVDARTTITKNRLLGGFVLGWNGRRIVVPKELPGIDILIGDISAQITSANKEPHAEAAAPDPHGESADGAKEPAP